MLETEVQREEISCCQTCLRNLLAVRTFRSTAERQHVAPLSIGKVSVKKGVHQTSLRVRERGVSNKLELTWDVFNYHCSNNHAVFIRIFAILFKHGKEIIKKCLDERLHWNATV